MGAWGYEPLDSDQALDWLGNEITDHIESRIGLAVDRFLETANNYGVNYASDAYAHSVRAAAYVVEALNFFHPRADLHARLEKALVAIRDSAWPSEWDDPEAIREKLNEQIEAMAKGPRSTTLMENLDD